MRPLLAALLLLPSLGFGQTLVLTVNGATSTITGTGSTSTVSTYAKNASACSNQVAGNWVGTQLTTACTPLIVWLTIGTCGSVPSTTNIPLDVTVNTWQAGTLAGGLATDSFTFAFNGLPGFGSLTDGGTSVNCGDAADFTNYLCAAVTLKDSTGACTSTLVSATPVNMRYDNIPPDPPSVGVTPLDNALSVRLTAAGSGQAVTDIQSFSAAYALDVDGGTPSYTSRCGTISVNNPACTISNLINGVNYLVVGYSTDEAGNISGPTSPPAVGTPVISYGFYANYLDSGGQPAGGCGDAAGGAPSALALLSVLLIAVARRRG